MSFSPALSFDFNERLCLAELKRHGVEYLLVGGYAVRFHGHLRPTKDVDVLVGNDPANAVRLCAALAAIIGPHPNLTPEQIAGRKRQINFAEWGYAFEVLTAADGVDFSESYERRQFGSLTPPFMVPIISKPDLITMKLRAGRPQDVEDVRALGGAAAANPSEGAGPRILEPS